MGRSLGLGSDTRPTGASLPEDCRTGPPPASASGVAREAYEELANLRLEMPSLRQTTTTAPAASPQFAILEPGQAGWTDFSYILSVLLSDFSRVLGLNLEFNPCIFPNKLINVIFITSNMKQWACISKPFS